MSSSQRARQSFSKVCVSALSALPKRQKGGLLAPRYGMSVGDNGFYHGAADRKQSHPSQKKPNFITKADIRDLHGNHKGSF